MSQARRHRTGPVLVVCARSHRELDETWKFDPANPTGDSRLRAALQELVEQAVAQTLPQVITIK